MKVNQGHRDQVVDGIKAGKKASSMQKELIGQGLTVSQSNSCVRNQRKKAGAYGPHYINREGSNKGVLL